MCSKRKVHYEDGRDVGVGSWVCRIQSIVDISDGYGMEAHISYTFKVSLCLMLYHFTMVMYEVHHASPVQLSSDTPCTSSLCLRLRGI